MSLLLVACLFALAKSSLHDYEIFMDPSPHEIEHIHSWTYNFPPISLLISSSYPVPPNLGLAKSCAEECDSQVSPDGFGPCVAFIGQVSRPRAIGGREWEIKVTCTFFTSPLRHIPPPRFGLTAKKYADSWKALFRSQFGFAYNRRDDIPLSPHPVDSDYCDENCEGDGYATPAQDMSFDFEESLQERPSSHFQATTKPHSSMLQHSKLNVLKTVLKSVKAMFTKMK